MTITSIIPYAAIVVVGGAAAVEVAVHYYNSDTTTTKSSGGRNSNSSSCKRRSSSSTTTLCSCYSTRFVNNYFVVSIISSTLIIIVAVLLNFKYLYWNNSIFHSTTTTTTMMMMMRQQQQEQRYNVMMKQLLLSSSTTRMTLYNYNYNCYYVTAYTSSSRTISVPTTNPSTTFIRRHGRSMRNYVHYHHSNRILQIRSGWISPLLSSSTTSIRNMIRSTSSTDSSNTSSSNGSISGANTKNTARRSNSHSSTHSRNNNNKNDRNTYTIAIIGGGPAGIYAAIHAAEAFVQQQSLVSKNTTIPKCSIIIYEATSQVLRKVKISGGGRCNVIHDTTISSDVYLQKGYPRGNKELRSICYQTYPPINVQSFFHQYNVTLKTEIDGRMFPITDTSQTIIDALLMACNNIQYNNMISIQYRTKVIQIIPPPSSSSSNIVPIQQQSTNSTTTDTSNNTTIIIPSSTFNQQQQYQIITSTSISNQQNDDDSDTELNRSNNNNNNNNKSTISTTYVDAVIVATGSAPVGYTLVTQPSLSGTSKSQNAIISEITPDVTSTTVTSSNQNNQHSTSKNSCISHPFISTVPSLFTFNCKHAVTERKNTIETNPSSTNGMLYNLAGISVPKVRVSFAPLPTAPIPTKATPISVTTDSKLQPKKKKNNNKIPSYFVQEGPILITHHGLSGPAILRLSAFGARELADYQYRGIITINWIPDLVSQQECFDLLWSMTNTNPKKAIVSQCPIYIPPPVTGILSTTSSPSSDISSEDNNNNNNNNNNDPIPNKGTITSSQQLVTALPKRLWHSIVLSCNISDTLCWGSVNKQQIRTLSERLVSCPIEMTSKSTNKDEFVTAGGIDLSYIQMKSMSSKLHDGLYFCGEVLNIDGITGGFNFYNCWSTGYVAGTSAASYIQQLHQQQNEQQQYMKDDTGVYINEDL